MSLAVTVLRLIIVHIEVIVVGMFMVVGFGTIPLLARISAGGMPAFIAEPLANGLWKVAMITQGTVLCNQLETDEYDLERPENPDDLEPRNHWSRLFGVRFGLDYDRTKEAFGGCAEEVDPSVLADGSGLPGKRAELGPDRGKRKTFIGSDHEPGLFVRFGEAVAELKDSDGLDSVNVAQDQTEKTEGGNDSMGSLAKAIYWSAMGMMGGTIGMVMFFL